MRRPRRAPLFGGTNSVEALYNPEGQQRGGFLRLVLRRNRGVAVGVDEGDRTAVSAESSGTGAKDPGGPMEAAEVRALRLGPFNTNPVLAGYLAGALAVRRSSDGGAEVAVTRVRTLLAPLVASQGDRLFWGGLRPALALIGFVSAFLWFGEPALWYGLGYNAVQLYWRRRAWRVGLRGEEAVREEIRRRSLEGWIRALGRITRLALGAALGAALAGPAVTGEYAKGAAVLAALVAGYGLGRSRRISSVSLAWIGILGSGILAAVHVLLP